MYQFTALWDGDAYNPFGPTATPIIFTTITIQGNGATLQRTGSGNARLFAVGYATINDTLDNKGVSGTGNLTLQDVYVTGFHVKGGDGGDGGGGGGLGAGGAIYVGKTSSSIPSLTVENSTFEANGAKGGFGRVAGGSGGLSGGGGGGLSGDGGDGGFPPEGAGGGGGGARGQGGQGHAGAGGGGGTVFGVVMENHSINSTHPAA